MTLDRCTLPIESAEKIQSSSSPVWALRNLVISTSSTVVSAAWVRTRPPLLDLLWLVAHGSQSHHQGFPWSAGRPPGLPPTNTNTHHITGFSHHCSLDLPPTPKAGHGPTAVPMPYTSDSTWEQREGATCSEQISTRIWLE